MECEHINFANPDKKRPQKFRIQTFKMSIKKIIETYFADIVIGMSQLLQLWTIIHPRTML